MDAALKTNFQNYSPNRNTAHKVRTQVKYVLAQCSAVAQCINPGISSFPHAEQSNYFPFPSFASCLLSQPNRIRDRDWKAWWPLVEGALMVGRGPHSTPPPTPISTNSENRPFDYTQPILAWQFLSHAQIALIDSVWWAVLVPDWHVSVGMCPWCGEESERRSLLWISAAMQAGSLLAQVLSVALFGSCLFPSQYYCHPPSTSDFLLPLPLSLSSRLNNVLNSLATGLLLALSSLRLGEC